MNSLPLVAATLLAWLPAPADPAQVDYNRQVRPILSDKCYACHGPDAENREAELRLDVRDEALKPAESGKPAIVPGKPEGSTLVARIHSTKKGLVMPPPDSNKTLTDAEKKILRDWITQGAKFQTHWAFQTPVRPPLPRVSRPEWVKNPIDQFILAKLDAEKLAPSPEADRATLLRRVTLDLTGLPPTLAELDAFLADTRPDAYERAVDRLLDSPRYGERMALDWLDAARYADTHGYHIDSGRDMTRWREWVINAFNRNLPYDQFTIEQLAGDLLPNPTLDQQIASGFHRNHMITFEGGVIPEEYLTAYIVDRVNTTGTVWLGMTVACTQCHDHKYDPMTQKEFYQLFAFFNGVPESGVDGSKGNAAPMIKAPRPEQQEELARVDAAIQALRAKLDAAWPEADAAQTQWEAGLEGRKGAAWSPQKPKRVEARNGTRLTVDKTGVINAAGRNPDVDTFTVVIPTAKSPITALRVELLPDPKLAGGGPGRSVNGNVTLSDVRIQVRDASAKDARPVAIARALADFSQQNYPASNAIDADGRSAWAVYPEVGKEHHIDLLFNAPVAAPEGELTVALSFDGGSDRHTPGKFRISATSDAVPAEQGSLPTAIASALQVPSAQRTEAQQKAIRNHFREKVFNPSRGLGSKLAELTRQRADLETQVPTTMVMASMSAPRDTFFLVRGQYDKKGEKVQPDVPSFLPPLPDGAKRDRLALARWLVDPKHPLVGRVTVNRIWQTFFGTGFVRTAEDFGSQGEPPSHPELIDWLAVEFMTPEKGTRGWDVKALVRRIVTSATYRQKSAVTPEVLAKDPENRLLARGPRVRLQAEFVRDQALAVSGLLNPEIGGKSVSPYQPAGLWEELMSREDGKNWSAQVYEQSHGKDLYRRSMYTFWKRTSPPPSLLTFDAPDRETCTVRRARTNTPLQALVLLNDPTYVEAARKLAERMLTEGGTSPEEHVAYAFRLCTARRPSAKETDVLLGILAKDRARYQADPAAARKLLEVGEAPRNPKLDTVDLAAWSTVASVILNLDETLNKN